MEEIVILTNIKIIKIPMLIMILMIITIVILILMIMIIKITTSKLHLHTLFTVSKEL